MYLIGKPRVLDHVCIESGMRRWPCWQRGVVCGIGVDAPFACNLTHRSYLIAPFHFANFCIRCCKLFTGTIPSPSLVRTLPA